MLGKQGVALSLKDARAIGKAVQRVKAISIVHAGERRGLAGTGETSSELYATVINTSEQDLEAYSVVRLERSAAKQNRGSGDTFPLRHHVWNCELPNAKLSGVYGVLQSKALKGSTAQALIVGITKVRLDDSNEGLLASPLEDSAWGMKTGASGTYPVISVDAVGEADTWGYVALGVWSGSIGSDVVFPVKLSQSGGADGDATTKATWTYDILDLDDKLLSKEDEPEDIGLSPHQWRRSYGKMTQATFGHAHYIIVVEEVAVVSNGDWDDSESEVQEGGAFADYEWQDGDVMEVTAGNGATLGTYPVTSRVSDDAVTLGGDLTDSGEYPFTGAVWANGTSTLTATGTPFADYTFVSGDQCIITGGTGVSPGTYAVSSRVGDASIVLSESIGPDSSTGDIVGKVTQSDVDITDGSIVAVIKRNVHKPIVGWCNEVPVVTECE